MQTHRITIATAVLIVVFAAAPAIVPCFQAKPIFTIRMRHYQNEGWETIGQMSIWDDGSYCSRFVDNESDFFPSDLSDGQLTSAELKDLQGFIQKQRGDGEDAKYDIQAEATRQSFPDAISAIVMHYWFVPIPAN